MRYFLVALGLWIVGGVLAATVNGYGAYVMVVLDLLGIAVLIVGIPLTLCRRRRRNLAAPSTPGG